MKNTMKYLDYICSLEFDEEHSCFVGKILGTKSIVSITGETAQEMIDHFHKEIDDYLLKCKKEGIEPEHPYKGCFNVRISPYIHRQAAEYAMDHEISLNTLVNQALRAYLKDNK